MRNMMPVMYDHVHEVYQPLSWLAHVTPESAELFHEVITQNAYVLQAAHVRNHTVIDVGANQGMFTLLALTLGAPQVIAIEPVPDTFNVLCANVSKAQLSHKMISMCKAVCAPDQSHVTIHVSDKSGHSSQFKPGSHTHVVAACDLAQLVRLADHDSIYLKMDCEGAEWDIMMKTPDPIFDRIQHVALEIHGDLHPEYSGTSSMHDRLMQLGYHMLNRYQMGMWYPSEQSAQPRFEPGADTIELWSK